VALPAAGGAAGLAVEEIEALGPGPARAAIEEETNRLDDQVYEALDVDERWLLLGALGALADGLAAK
jgi:hypothetical protein